jgi:hypothetical protein
MAADGGNSHPNYGAAQRAVPGKVRIRSLSDLDKRTAAAKRALSVRDGLISDRGADPTVAEMELCQRASVLSAIIEHVEAEWLSGEPIDVPGYCTLVSTQKRIFDSFGLDRRPKDVTPSLTQYLREVKDER